ncbi:unnamed protein product, partial [Effrenium voratum]
MACPSTRPRARLRRRSRRRWTRRAAASWLTTLTSCRIRCPSLSRPALRRQRRRRRRRSPCTPRRWPRRAPLGPMPSLTRPPRKLRKTKRPRPDANDGGGKAAEYIAYQDGLPIHEAKAEAAAAVQEAITAQGGHFVEPQILPDPIPEAMKEGIAAAETKKAQSAPMHDQAVAAAGATGAKAVQEEDTETAQRDATKVAEYVIHNEGVAITK